MTTTDPAPPALMVEHHDPATLLVDHNIRALRLDKGLVDSIRDLGVLQPVIGVRTEARAVRVRLGHRRTLAAIEAGQPYVPVIIIGAEGDDDVERVLGQYAENTHREALNAAEQAGVITQLLDLGLTAAQVHKRTRMPKPAIAAARAVHGSPVAAAAAVKHDLTLDHAAGVAEFDNDPEAVRDLLEASLDGDGEFRHQLQQLRDERTYEQARAAAAAELQAAGITVLDASPGWEKDLNLLTAADTTDRTVLTAETHKDCPGHAAWMTRYWTGDAHAWAPRWFCTDPKANGHKKLTAASGTGASGNDLETQQEERRKVIEGNKKWRTAETVRRQWLTEFLTRKEAPKDALKFIIESIARADNALRHSAERHYTMPHELLGLDPHKTQAGSGTYAYTTTTTQTVVDAIAHASDARAVVIGLGLILGAYEETTGVHIWRSPGGYSDIARYLTALTGWGYQLSEIEQTITDAQPS